MHLCPKPKANNELHQAVHPGGDCGPGGRWRTASRWCAAVEVRQAVGKNNICFSFLLLLGHTPEIVILTIFFYYSDSQEKLGRNVFRAAKKALPVIAGYKALG